MLKGLGVTNPLSFANGELIVGLEPAQLFVDPFDSGSSLDTAVRWTAPTASGGGVLAAQATGNLTLGTGTTINGYSYLSSQPAFSSSTPAWIRFANNIQLEYPITANTYRAWGAGKVQAVPTAANPISDGAVFEVATNGKMYAVVYKGAVRTVISDLSVLNPFIGIIPQPADNATHNYQVYYRPTQSFWYIDGVLVATSTFAQSALNVETLNSIYMAVAGTSAPGSSGVLTSDAVSVSDTGHNAQAVSDGQFPFRKATVTANGALSVANGSAPVTAFTSQSAGGTNGATVDNGVARSNHTLFVMTGAGVSAGVVTLQGSNDGVNWFSTTCIVTTIAATTPYAAALANFPFRYVRASITTVITGGTVTATTASC